MFVTGLTTFTCNASGCGIKAWNPAITITYLIIITLILRGKSKSVAKHKATEYAFKQIVDLI